MLVEAPSMPKERSAFRSFPGYSCRFRDSAGAAVFVDQNDRLIEPTQPSRGRGDHAGRIPEALGTVGAGLGDGEPVGFLCRTAMNLYRKRLRRAAIALRMAANLLPSDDALAAVEARDQATRLLRTLTPREREALVLTVGLGSVTNLLVSPRWPGGLPVVSRSIAGRRRGRSWLIPMRRGTLPFLHSAESVTLTPRRAD